MSDAIQTGADAALQAPVTPAAVVSPVSIPDGVVASNRTKEAAQEWELTDDQPRPREAYWSRDKVVRSEEHTSELQSLMRISYAVFCLKKKKKLDNIQTHQNTQ